MNFFKSPFEKLSNIQQERIALSTELTMKQVSPGGDLFNLFLEMRDYLKVIAAKGTGKVSISGRDAKAVSVGVQGIGQGMKLIAEAINALPDGKETKLKMDAIVTGIDAIKEMGMAILTFAGMLALSLPLLILGIPALLIAIPMVLLVGGMFWLLGKMGITKEIKEVSTGLAIAGLAFVSLSAGLVLSAMILEAGFGGKGAGLVVSVGLFLTAIILGTAVVFSIAGLMSSFIQRGAMAMLWATLPILALSVSLAIFSAAVPPNADGWTTIGQVGAAVTGLGLVMAGAGLAAPLIIPGAGAMLIAGLALLSIAGGISAISNVLKPSMFAKGGIFADSGMATEPIEVFGITIIEGGRAMSNLEWSLLTIARSFMLPPLAIAGMYAGAPALIMSGLALLSIAKGIEKFQALDIDYESLPANIAKVTTVLAKAFGEIGVQYPGGGPSISSLLTGDYSGTSPVYQGIKAVSGMGKALTGIAMGVQAMAMLKFPTKWDKDGNPIEFRELKDEDFDRVGINTQKIVLALSKTFSEVGSSEAAQGGGWFRKNDYEKGISVIAEMGDPLTKIAEFVKSFTSKNIKDEDIAAVSNKTKSIIQGLTSAFMQKADGTPINPSDMATAAEAYDDMAESTGNMADYFIEFKDGINDLDLEKVVEVRKMYEALASLSKSEGTIVEEMSSAMIEAIEMLAEKLSEFAGSVKDGSDGGFSISDLNPFANKSVKPDAPAGGTAPAPAQGNAELLSAINKLQKSLSGTLPVYVTNRNI